MNKFFKIFTKFNKITTVILSLLVLIILFFISAYTINYFKYKPDPFKNDKNIKFIDLDDSSYYDIVIYLDSKEKTVAAEDNNDLKQGNFKFKIRLTDKFENSKIEFQSLIAETDINFTDYYELHDSINLSTSKDTNNFQTFTINTSKVYPYKGNLPFISYDEPNLYLKLTYKVNNTTIIEYFKLTPKEYSKAYNFDKIELPKANE